MPETTITQHLVSYDKWRYFIFLTGEMQDRHVLHSWIITSAFVFIIIIIIIITIIIIIINNTLTN
jgi:hypothetical protein